MGLELILSGLVVAMVAITLGALWQSVQLARVNGELSRSLAARRLAERGDEGTRRTFVREALNGPPHWMSAEPGMWASPEAGVSAPTQDDGGPVEGVEIRAGF